MIQLPPTPAWDSMHPLLIHFPLTLFFVAPVFALLAIITKEKTRVILLTCALGLMLAGISSGYVAFEAGQAAVLSSQELRQAQLVLERHQEFARLALSSFTLATLLFGLTLLICRWLRLQAYELTGVLPFGSVIFYAVGLFWLINTAYYGERLVHEFHVGQM